MPHIDYYFATISPYTYLSGTRPAEVAKRHGATITYKPLDIMALFARTGGTAPKDRHPNRAAYRLQDMARRAKLLGKPLNPQPMFFPTSPTMQVGPLQELRFPVRVVSPTVSRTAWVAPCCSGARARIRISSPFMA